MITSLPQKFDVDKILSLLPDVQSNQISLTHSENNPSWDDGSGSLYDYDARKFVSETSAFTILNEALRGTYVEEVLWTIKEQAALDGVSIGRVRVLKLLPKTCYTLHQDPDEFRYHVPLISNYKCFFVTGERVERMPTIGRLYKFETQEEHTAVNASFYERVHLVLDTFKQLS